MRGRQDGIDNPPIEMVLHTAAVQAGLQKKNKERKGVERLQTKSVGDVREGDGVLLSLKRWFR